MQRLSQVSILFRSSYLVASILPKLLCFYNHLSESESHSVVSDSLRPRRLYSPWNSSGQNTGVGSLPFLQGIFPIQGLNPHLLHCRRILCQLSHRGSPGILEWVAIPSPTDLPDPGIESGSPALQGDSLPIELSGKPIITWSFDQSI